MSAAAVVLAAGKGTRFRSDTAKVLHRAAGRSLLGWVLESLRPLGLDRVIVVVGHQAEAVAAEADAVGVPGTVSVTQPEQRGTGHAVRLALASGQADDADTVLVLPGDVPLLRPEPLAGLLADHAEAQRAATLLTARLPDPTGYGRVVRDGQGAVRAVVEERDADAPTRQIDEINTGVAAYARDDLARALGALSTDNAQGEEYLTDAVAALATTDAAQRGVGAIAGDPEAVHGVNDRAQLADVAAALRRRLLDRLMRADGVTVIDPAATYVDADVTVGADTTLLPGTILEGATHVGAGARIGPHSHLTDTVVGDGATVTSSTCTGARIGPGASVGPYSHLRTGTELAAGAKVGAFCETKSAALGEGAKVPHLSYIGDATVGAGANVGAATVTVNYDGFAKHRTEIGEGARIGSDTMLVAPVRVGREAYTGAGSVITQDVPDGALGLSRSDQVIKEGYAERKRARHQQRAEGGQP